VDEKIKQLDLAIYNIAEKVEKNILNYINPTNSKKQKDLFFESINKHNYEQPYFEYQKFDKQFIQKLKEELLKIEKQLQKSKLEEYLKIKASNLESELELILSIDTKDFCKNSKKAYGKPSKKLITLSKEILCKKFKNESRQKTIQIEQVKRELEKKMSDSNTGFSVIIDEQMSAKAAVNLNERKVKLNSNALFSLKDINRLFVHEVETHVYRYLNGEKQTVKALAFGSGEDYLKTEEGLALYNEKQTKVESEEQEKKYAGRAIAVDYALKHDFFETFDYLNQFFDKEEAHAITQRVKRGIPYGSKGAFTKDYCYMDGFLQINEETHKGLKIEELYVGKICSKEIGLVKKIPGVKKASYLPTWLNSK